MFHDIFTQTSIFARLSLIVAVAPMLMGVFYAVRPSEARLALMRPLSLAGLFAGLAALLSGLISILRGMAATPAFASDRVWLGLSEAAIPLFIALGCLTVGWVCVTLGLMRQP